MFECRAHIRLFSVLSLIFYYIGLYITIAVDEKMKLFLMNSLNLNIILRLRCPVVEIIEVGA